MKSQDFLTSAPKTHITTTTILILIRTSTMAPPLLLKREQTQVSRLFLSPFQLAKDDTQIYQTINSTFSLSDSHKHKVIKKLIFK